MCHFPTPHVSDFLFSFYQDPYYAETRKRVNPVSELFGLGNLFDGVSWSYYKVLEYSSRMNLKLSLNDVTS